MRRAFSLILAAALAVGLAGCGTTGDGAAQLTAIVQQVDAATGEAVDFACKNEPAAKLAYTAAVLTGQVKRTAKKDAYFAAVERGCQARANGQNSIAVALTVLAAYKSIRAEIPVNQTVPTHLKRLLLPKNMRL